MKIVFWISLFLPLAVLAQDMDYFAPTDVVSTPEPSTKHEPKKGWGQGMLDKIENLVTHHAAPKVEHTQLTPEYLQRQLNAKEIEIVQIRQQLTQTMDGQKIQSLTGTLQRLEGEHKRISEDLRTIRASATSSMAAPTPAVMQVSLPTEMSEEDALKMQLERFTQEEVTLTNQIKATTDANILSNLGSQLERTQQNKSLAILSLKDVQRRNIENSTSGFGATLLPPHGMEAPAMTAPQPLTPSLEQVVPAAMPTPWPAGWGKMTGPAPAAAPAPAPTAITPVGTPVTGEAWNQVHAQATENLGGTSKPEMNKDTHATYAAPHKPLWTPNDALAPARKSVPHHAPIDHKHIVEKIRGHKVF